MYVEIWRFCRKKIVPKRGNELSWDLGVKKNVNKKTLFDKFPTVTWINLINETATDGQEEFPFCRKKNRSKRGENAT